MKFQLLNEEEDKEIIESALYLRKYILHGIFTVDVKSTDPNFKGEGTFYEIRDISDAFQLPMRILTVKIPGIEYRWYSLPVIETAGSEDYYRNILKQVIWSEFSSEEIKKSIELFYRDRTKNSLISIKGQLQDVQTKLDYIIEHNSLIDEKYEDILSDITESICWVDSAIDRI